MKNKILIIDDAEVNRDMLEFMLEDEYKVLKASDVETALELLDDNSNEIAVILLDLLMPERDGFSFLDEMNERELIGKIPILVITSDDDVETERRCFNYGVSDFIHKPFDNIVVRRRVENIVNLFDYSEKLQYRIDTQTEILQAQLKQLRLQSQKIKKANDGIVEFLGAVIESRHLGSVDHVKKVKQITNILANEVMRIYPEYGLTEEKIGVITATSALHDIGKIAVPDSVLLKNEKLTKKDVECMKSHVEQGVKILGYQKGAWDDEYQQTAVEICHYHHERADGKGYPCGLKGDEIPISAQIVALADVYDELVSERAYLRKFSAEDAATVIYDGKFGVFSEKMLKVFSNVRKDLENLYK